MLSVEKMMIVDRMFDEKWEGFQCGEWPLLCFVGSFAGLWMFAFGYGLAACNSVVFHPKLKTPFFSLAQFFMREFEFVVG